MYKKTSMLLAGVVLLSFPAMAQGKGDQIIKTGAEFFGGTLTTAVTREIGKQTLEKFPEGVSRVPFGNVIRFPNLIQVMKFIPDFNTPWAADVFLQAIEDSKKKALYNAFHNSQEMYDVPRPFAQMSQQELYRVVKLNKWADLEALLKDGIKIDKTRRGDRIFANSDLSVSITAALSKSWETSFPVLMRIKPTDQFLQDNPPVHFQSEWIFSHDIPADMISDFMIFVKVKDKSGWYKARWRDSQVELIEVPSANLSIK